MNFKLSAQKFYALSMLQERHNEGDVQAQDAARTILAQDLKTFICQPGADGPDSPVRSLEEINKCQNALDAIQQDEAPLLLLDRVMAALA